MPEPTLALRSALIEQGLDLRAQEASDWQGEIPLPADIARFYRDIGPDNCNLATAGNSFFIPALARLWRMQAGYRWHGISGECLTDWHDDWLVVADQGGDPFIFEISSGKVLHDRHGGGSWQPAPIFDNLEQMIAGLATFDAVWNSAGEDIFLDNYSVNPRHRERLIDALVPLLGSQSAAQSLADEFGW
ncbi:hypothetical protein SRABI70_02214 [Pseudomonas sp. Bi70]|uniref:hypothetical protein n=1 Tax=Pseudomonas sp. Bi70 TaxID=2821127 RepID=UPI001D6EAAC5|nr:hypothetical protein [Pseudomonas sp. Bi70]CAH0220243.1 hypothetical protein SRABI70_02214 [Pseudomonas sp. Bi70]